MTLSKMSDIATSLFGGSGGVGFAVRSLKTGNEFRVVNKLRGGKFVVVGLNVDKDSLLDGTVEGRYEPIGKLATAIGISSQIVELNSELSALGVLE